MKKMLHISIIVGIVFVAGCIGGEKVTDTGQKSVTETSDLIIKQSDVPGLPQIKSYYFAFPKSRSLVNVNSRILAGWHMNMVGDDIVKVYEDTLPVGTKNVGQNSNFLDNSGRRITVSFTKFDSNSEFKKYFVDKQEVCKNIKTNLEGCGLPNIGDDSYYSYRVRNNQPDVETIVLEFVHRNYFVYIEVIDEKEKSLNEAIRIAKIVESRIGEKATETSELINPIETIAKTTKTVAPAVGASTPKYESNEKYQMYDNTTRLIENTQEQINQLKKNNIDTKAIEGILSDARTELTKFEINEECLKVGCNTVAGLPYERIKNAFQIASKAFEMTKTAR